MNDKLYMTPIVGWMLFDKSIASITDNHGNRVSGWSASCANGHEEGYVLTLDKIRMVKQVEIAAFKDLIGTAAGSIDLGDLPSPLQQYCDIAKQGAANTRD